MGRGQRKPGEVGIPSTHMKDRMGWCPTKKVRESVRMGKNKRLQKCGGIRAGAEQTLGHYLYLWCVAELGRAQLGMIRSTSRSLGPNTLNFKIK